MLAQLICKHEVIMTEKDENKIAAARARANALSPERRSEIARNAADHRWSGQLATAEYEGSFQLGNTDISCAVLPDKTRVITQATFLRALGRSRSPKAGTGILSTVDNLPFFLQADVMKPFISDELLEATKPVFYYDQSGAKSVGYDARILPQVAEVYLRFRDDCLRTSGKVPPRYEKMIAAADVLMRALANVGIIALVDEATGFQRDRAADALARILEDFIAKELRPWVQTFPDQYYEELFRLRGLNFPRDGVKRPKYFGHLTNDIIYARLAPGVVEELKATTPKDNKGRRKHHFHRRLTEDIGHPKLREHMAAVVTAMQLSEDYEGFIRNLDRVRPRYDRTLPLPLREDSGKGL